MLGERVAGAEGARVGPDQPRRGRRRARREADALADRLAAGPDRAPTPGTKRQLNAWLFARMEEQLELEATIQQEIGRLARLPRGRAGLPREAPAGVRGSLKSADRAGAKRPPRVHILPALVPEGRYSRRARCSRCSHALAAALLAAPAAHAGLFFPEKGGSPNADSIQTLYVLIFVLALFIFIGRRGRC